MVTDRELAERSMSLVWRVMRVVFCRMLGEIEEKNIVKEEKSMMEGVNLDR